MHKNIGCPAQKIPWYHCTPPLAYAPGIVQYLRCRVNQGFQVFQALRDQKVILDMQAQKDRRENHQEVVKAPKAKRFVGT